MLSWYLQINQFASMLIGVDAWIGVKWLHAYNQRASDRLREDPENVGLLLESLVSKVRMLGLEAQKADAGKVTMTKLWQHGQWIAIEIRSGTSSPGLYFASFCRLWLDFLMIARLYLGQARRSTLARQWCRALEAMELCPQVPVEAILPLRRSLLVACIYLPQEKGYPFWCRERLARLEGLGYALLPNFRIS